MLPRGVKFAHAAVLLFAALLAFLNLRALDEEVIIGASQGVLVQDFGSGAASSDRVIGEIESLADELGVNVAYESQDLLSGPGARRQLYLSVGDPDSPSSSWLERGYPEFSRDLRTEVHPMRELRGLDPRGTYLVFGPQESARELLAKFERLGYQGTLFTVPSPLNPTTYFGQEGTLESLFIMTVAIVMTVGAGVVLNAKTYGVLRLQGRSFAQILGRDMVLIAAFWVRAAALVATLVAAALFAYNGLSRPAYFGLFFAVFLAALALPALVAHALALAITYRTRITDAIKGETSGTLAMLGTCSVRVVASLLTLAVAISTFTAAREVAAQQASREAFAKIGDASVPVLTSDPADREVEKRYDRKIGAWIHDAESRGEVIIATRADVESMTPPGKPTPKRDVLIVNDEYLAEQTVLDASGRRLAGLREPGVKAQILLPGSLPRAEKDRLASSIFDWLKSEADLYKAELNDREIETLSTKPGQRVFTYGSFLPTGGTDELADAMLSDPVIVVVPKDSDILDGGYPTYATQGGVIFKDPRYIKRAMSTGVGEFLIGAEPVARRAATEYWTTVREFRITLFNTIAALAVLLISAASAALIYRRKNTQSLFVKYINGWPFAKAHASLLALEAALALALLGWVSWQTISRLLTERELAAQYRAEGIPPPPVEAAPLAQWQPAVMLAVVAAGFLTTVMVLALSQGVMIRRQAIEE
ncbi:MAG: hypothetical protein IRY88_15585 [Rubrobacteraceae bacterium]|nr:hypothetical protein [Rubrobacteraceae bacterium]